ncbi:AraC family transcriptional regulator [Dysgonomonas sp. 511]|uniref:AraC family transcriptional regulator n=1 Tax=Dysgonomonas sp. 511 TaxID=2302930 RepID=UPI0013D07D76|nr:AraC family transcriptional regulator [Dysgonomonas sp. 511]NDV77394.1 AraC family transcriptional regulator [Dysgonomonas sp. 511]
MKDSILREVTPLSKRDCFMIFSRVKQHFTFPIHVHTEFELNFIENGGGAKRVVGDSIEVIDDLELTLVTGSNLEHGWLDHKCSSKEIKEITIQFHGDLFNEELLQKNQFRTVKEMFEKAVYGVTFSKEAIMNIKERLYKLAQESQGAHSVLKLLGILYDLSLSPVRELSSRAFYEKEQRYDSRRIERAYNYMQANYNKEIRLSDVANVVGMTEVAFSRFIKQRTGRNFIDSLNDIRLGHAARMLIDTTHSVAEISIDCGFNNLSNFNRIFKKKKGCTPREFRENYKESKFFV